MLQNLSSAAFMISALRVKMIRGYFSIYASLVVHFQFVGNNNNNNNDNYNNNNNTNINNNYNNNNNYTSFPSALYQISVSSLPLQVLCQLDTQKKQQQTNTY